MPVQQLLHHCSLSLQLTDYLHTVCYEKKWSNRTQVKLIRLARTIADLAQEQEVKLIHLEEAIRWKEGSLPYEGSVVNG